MARSSLMRWVQRMAADVRDSIDGPARAPAAKQRERIESRRAFIARMAALGAWSSLPAFAAPARSLAGRGPRIVIVGAGLAGLAAAYELRKSGIGASIVEAAPRPGGRCLSERRAFADDQVAERGGELVDTNHDALIDLALELRLTLDDLIAAETPNMHASFYFDGAKYSDAEVTRDLQRLWPALKRDAAIIGEAYPTFRRHTPAQLRLDAMSCTQWLDERVNGGAQSRFGRLLANAYIEELGGDPDEISAISVVGLLSGSPQDHFSPYEESDQRYHIRGGNDQLVERMTAALGENLRTGTRLVALKRMGDGRMRLTLQRDQAVEDVVADRVVLAMPFSLLRQVDASGAGFNGRKLRCIRELGMGRNTKLQLQFEDRWWLQVGGNGETRTDGSYQVSWEVTRAQPGRAGILNFFSGGSTAVRAGEGTPEERARDALDDLQRVLPGVADSWNKRVIRNAWDRYPWTLGSYSLLKPGQYTTLHGIEDSVEGRVHFAGEQSSMQFAGYMNGAIESGQRAAREVLDALRVRTVRRAA